MHRGGICGSNQRIVQTSNPTVNKQLINESVNEKNIISELNFKLFNIQRYLLITEVYFNSICLHSS